MMVSLSVTALTFIENSSLSESASFNVTNTLPGYPSNMSGERWVRKTVVPTTCELQLNLSNPIMPPWIECFPRKFFASVYFFPFNSNSPSAILLATLPIIEFMYGGFPFLRYPSYDGRVCSASLFTWSKEIQEKYKKMIWKCYENGDSRYSQSFMMKYPICHNKKYWSKYLCNLISKYFDSTTLS